VPISRTEKLRREAATERQKVQEIDRLLARIEARLAEGRPAAKAAKTGSERRGSERLVTDLVIRYRWPGHHAPLVGRVRDLSRGGLRFSASRQLRVGETLQASVPEGTGSAPQMAGEMYLEVMHCRREGDVWEVGARFVALPTSRFEADERRIARRFPVKLDMAFRLAGAAGAPQNAEVRDISSGGLRFFTTRRLPVGALASVAVVSDQAARGSAGTRIALNALIKVVRCRRMGARYEAGAQFVSLP
jgi:hypothetical protein